MSDEDQKKANEMTASMLEALAASIRDGRADVRSAKSTNGFRVRADSPPNVEHYEYDGSGKFVVMVNVKPGLFWIDGHPFERRGEKPAPNEPDLPGKVNADRGDKGGE